MHLLTGQLVLLLGVRGAPPLPGAPAGRDGQADQVSTAHLNPLLAVAQTGPGRQHHQQRQQHTLVDPRHDSSSQGGAWTQGVEKRRVERVDEWRRWFYRETSPIVGLDFWLTRVYFKNVFFLDIEVWPCG